MVTAAIPHFVAFEVRNVTRRMRAVRCLPVRRQTAMVAVAWVEMVIDMAMEVPRSMEPRSGANKHAAIEPLRSVVAVGSAVIRGVIVVAVWTHRFRTVLHAKAHLGRMAAPEEQQERCGNKQILES